MEIVYVKYNKNRLPQFQIETTIAIRENQKIVIKKALTKEADRHLENIYVKYLGLTKGIVDNRVKLQPILEKNNDSLVFEFIEGISFEKLFLDAFLKKDKDKFLDLIDGYYKFIHNSFKTADHFFLPQDTAFIFNDLELLKGREKYFNAISNIDAIFSNIIFDNGSYYIIDNEWLFEGNLPISFVFYRSWFIFCQRYHRFGIEDFVPFNKLLDDYNFSAEIKEIYFEMEKSFQNYVFGEERLYENKHNYIKKSMTIQSIIDEKNRIINDIINEKDNVINEKDNIIKEKEEQLANIFNSQGWKVLLMYYKIRDYILPTGTKRKELLKMIFGIFKNGKEKS